MQVPMLSTALASEGYQLLCRNAYFGRLVMAGLSPDGLKAYLLTAISGRSAGSQNRRYVLGENGTVRTEVADGSQPVGDPALTLYETHVEKPTLGLFAASNGAQTKDCVSSNALLKHLLGEWTFEPDAPNFTPRISGRVIALEGRKRPEFEFAIHRRAQTGGLLLENALPVQLEPGFGLYVTTYEGDGKPLPAFIGGPRLTTMSANPLADLKNDLRSFPLVAGIAMKVIPLERGAPTSVEIWNNHN